MRVCIAAFKNILKAIKEDIDSNKQDPEFIIILGDLAGHAREGKMNKELGVGVEESSIAQDLEIAYKELYKIFGEKKDMSREIVYQGIPMFYIFGNNDALKKANGAFYYDDPNKEGENKTPAEIAVRNKTGWKSGFLSTGVVCSSKSSYPCLHRSELSDRYGYYVASIRKDLKLIALNTVMFSLGYFNLPDPGDKLDPKKLSEVRAQLRWFKEQLDIAKKNKESVIVAIHNPPGDIAYLPGYTRKMKPQKPELWGKPFGYLIDEAENILVNLLVEHENEVVTILGAHVHYDEIKAFINKKGEMIGDLVIITPSLSTAEGNAPGLKYFYLDKELGSSMWGLEDYETFSIVQRRRGLAVHPEYGFRSEYCINASVAGKKIDGCVGNIDAKDLSSTAKLLRFMRKQSKNATVGNENLLRVPLYQPGAIFIDFKKVNVKEALIKKSSDNNKLEGERISFLDKFRNRVFRNIIAAPFMVDIF